MKKDEEYRHVLREAVAGANRSWTATDTLYASLCAAGIGAGSWLLNESNATGLLSLAILIIALSGSWIVLICRYRRKLKSLLERLKDASDEGSNQESYFDQTGNGLEKDLHDFLAPIVPMFAILVWAVIYWCGK